nr:hypothetical protein CFP56_43831 [Quercus suber]
MAQSPTIDLGQLDLVSTTAGLRLQVSSELAVLRRSAVGQYQSIKELCTADTLQRSYVKRADGFKIIVDIRLDICLSAALKDAAMEQLGFAIEKSPVKSLSISFPEIDSH